jgi:hypothetical protein
MSGHLGFLPHFSPCPKRDSLGKKPIIAYIVSIPSSYRGLLFFSDSRARFAIIVGTFSIVCRNPEIAPHGATRRAV